MKITLFFSLLLLTFTAQANGQRWQDEAATGALLLADDHGQIHPATLLDTDAHITVSGPVAEVTLTQRFHNSSQQFREGRYLFPLPENAAVDGMVLTIGDRRIVGRIDEKAEAEKTYRQARASGKKASLISQQRPNLFTTAVANIAPGETVQVELHYQQTLNVDGHRFQLRLPLTLTPRLTPPTEAPHTLDSLLRNTVAAPGGTADAGTASIHIDLDAGARLATLGSPSHAIRYQRHGRRYTITPKAGAIAMDRDLLLNWELEDTGEPLVASFHENIDGEHYALLMVVPPEAGQSTTLPRETLFIIDSSGSMGGAPMRQAKASLQLALQRLKPGDRFNITDFDSQHTLLFETPATVNDNSRQQAQQFVAGLQASGGTHMLPALSATLSQPASDGYLRQVIFITDGAVGNEHGIFQALHQQLGEARLFTVGIGSAPNSHFMTRAAQFGRGSFTYINDQNQVQQGMDTLFRRLESPLMRNLQVQLPNGIVTERWPQKLPDLYAGEPLLVAMKLSAPTEHITVSGYNTRHWQQSVTLPTDSNHPGTASLWARRKIADLMDRITLGAAETDIAPLVTDVALRHQLVSRYTSFIAVEESVSRPAHEPLLHDTVRNQAPHGTQRAAAWPSTATPAPLLWRLAGVLLIVCLLLWLHQRRAKHGTA
ncbi:marine proteobacterial sortase target protein [Alcanivorax sp.]|uniref:marine proteobacterial sortase target protein n=1 Tax=Alcanivorax sp. TaxID=1872427 RepID=UPI000C535D78|nr:marine proteobacterial sortase target protein [Alcanivorax sp.]MBQ24749.1 marine proteobacterial sortase target protein [Alcanivorax sp.]